MYCVTSCLFHGVSAITFESLPQSSPNRQMSSKIAQWGIRFGHNLQFREVNSLTQGPCISDSGRGKSIFSEVEVCAQKLKSIEFEQHLIFESSLK